MLIGNGKLLNWMMREKTFQIHSRINHHRQTLVKLVHRESFVCFDNFINKRFKCRCTCILKSNNTLIHIYLLIIIIGDGSGNIPLPHFVCKLHWRELIPCSAVELHISRDTEYCDNWLTLPTGTRVNCIAHDNLHFL